MKKKYISIEDLMKSKKYKNVKELWEKEGGAEYSLVLEAKAVFKKEESSNSFSVIMSTSVEDRHSDIVLQNWELERYKKNPVLLDSHDYSSIENILGKMENVRVEDGKLKGIIVLCLDNEKGILAKKMIEGGFLNTVSVGFVPLLFDKDGKILNSELLECSLVPVPANHEALIEKNSQYKKIDNNIKKGVSLKQDEINSSKSQELVDKKKEEIDVVKILNKINDKL